MGMSAIKTARYASLRDDDNCTLNEAKILLGNLVELGFRPPVMYVLNDSMPFDIAIGSVNMHMDTPVMVMGYWNSDPSSAFNISYLVAAQRERNSAWDLFIRAETILSPGKTNVDLIDEFVRQNKLEDELNKLLATVTLIPLPTPVNE